MSWEEPTTMIKGIENRSFEASLGIEFVYSGKETVKEFLNYLQVHEGLLQGGYSYVVLQMHRGPKEEINLFHLKKIVLKH